MSSQVQKIGFCAPWATGSSSSQGLTSGATIHLGPHRIGPPSVWVLASEPLKPSRALMKTHPCFVGKGPVPCPPEGCQHWLSQFLLEASVVSAGTSTSCCMASPGEVLVRSLSTPSWLLTSMSLQRHSLHCHMSLFLSISHGHGDQRRGGHQCWKRCCASCGEKASHRRPWSWSLPPPAS